VCVVSSADISPSYFIFYLSSLLLQAGMLPSFFKNFRIGQKSNCWEEKWSSQLT
jgi:hypothetical protein